MISKVRFLFILSSVILVTYRHSVATDLNATYSNTVSNCFSETSSATDVYLSDLEDLASDGSGVEDSDLTLLALGSMIPGEPAKPHKRKNGLWDQGFSGTCFATSLLNANIEAGASDGKKQFKKTFHQCLIQSGVGFSLSSGQQQIQVGWFWQWYSVYGIYPSQIPDILACKKIAMQKNKDDNGNPSPMNVELTWHPPLYNSERAITRAETIANAKRIMSLDPCEKISKALSSGGSAVAGGQFPTRGSGHAFQVTAAKKEGNICKLTIRDPRCPDETGTFDLDKDGMGRYQACSGSEQVITSGYIFTFVTEIVKNPGSTEDK